MACEERWEMTNSALCFCVKLKWDARPQGIVYVGVLASPQSPRVWDIYIIVQCRKRHIRSESIGRPLNPRTHKWMTARQVVLVIRVWDQYVLTNYKTLLSHRPLEQWSTGVEEELLPHLQVIFSSCTARGLKTYESCWGSSASRDGIGLLA